MCLVNKGDKGRGEKWENTSGKGRGGREIAISYGKRESKRKFNCMLVREQQ